MNYEKKRKRQNGRQKRKRTHCNQVWIDEYERLHKIIDKAIKDGILPPVTFDPSTLRTSFGGLQDASTQPGFPDQLETIMVTR